MVSSAVVTAAVVSAAVVSCTAEDDELVLSEQEQSETAEISNDEINKVIFLILSPFKEAADTESAADHLSFDRVDSCLCMVNIDAADVLVFTKTSQHAFNIIALS